MARLFASALEFMWSSACAESVTKSRSMPIDFSRDEQMAGMTVWIVVMTLSTPVLKASASGWNRVLFHISDMKRHANILGKCERTTPEEKPLWNTALRPWSYIGSSTPESVSTLHSVCPGVIFPSLSMRRITSSMIRETNGMSFSCTARCAVFSVEISCRHRPTWTASRRNSSLPLTLVTMFSHDVISTKSSCPRYTLLLAMIRFISAMLLPRLESSTLWMALTPYGPTTWHRARSSGCVVKSSALTSSRCLRPCARVTKCILSGEKAVLLWLTTSQ
mmetsp:Transcript_124/g.166  ORF Transcript_124/g.166 Transcript_124/m.166 type:complete len:277 (+) Transcript_124:307-1137(+)